VLLITLIRMVFCRVMGIKSIGAISCFVLFGIFEMGSSYIVQAGLGLGLSTILPQPVECWDYRWHTHWAH
jgi:hypothetical protein